MTQDRDWFSRDKFGMFIHWGLYALLAGEYQGRTSHHIAEWIMHDLNIPKAEYERLAAQFDPGQFDARGLVRLAKLAGMRYLCFTAKHHDGFAMFDSQADPYNAVQASPFQRDACRELAQACREEGIRLCFYYSQAQDWHHPGGLEKGSKHTNPLFPEYYKNKALPQITELLTQYGDLGLLWLDTPLGMDRSSCQALKAHIKSLQPNCLISGRIGHGLGDYLTTGDNFLPAQPPGFPFEVPATMNNTWGFKKSDTDWKPASRIIRDLVSVVSRGGNYLLNIGPDEKGRVPDASVTILKEIGAFMAQNGESIYDTLPVPPYPYALPWLGMTMKPHTLYLHVYEKMQAVYIINMGNTLKKATLLKDGRELAFVQGKTCEDDGYWQITLPPDLEMGPDTVIRCDIAEENVVFEPLKI